MESEPSVKRDLPGCRVKCPAGQFFILLPTSLSGFDPDRQLTVFPLNLMTVPLLSLLYPIVISNHLKMIIFVD